MFCGECGTKNTGTSQFCENCGAKLAGAPEQQANPSPVEGNVNNVQMNNVQPTQQNQMPNTQVMATQPAKPMSKQTKLILTIIAVLAALFGGVYYYLGTLVTPEKVAEDYFNALVEVDAKKIYKFLQVEQTDFTTEKMFEKVIKNTTDKSTKMEIVNYEVGKVKYDDLSKMTAKVTITYVEKDKEKSQTVDVKLAKGKDKKWLFYDQWLVVTTAYEIKTDVTVKVEKDAVVKVEGIKLDKKLIDKESSSSSYDYYKVPAMFGGKYKFNVLYKNGLETEELVNIASGGYYASLSASALTKKTKNEINKQMAADVQLLYDSAMANKPFDEIKSSFEFTDCDLTNLTSAYNSLTTELASSTNKLTKLKVSEAEVSSIYTNNDGSFNMSSTLKYDYTVSYQSGGQAQTHSDTATNYITFTYKKVDGKYKLTNIKYLKTYFSRY